MKTNCEQIFTKVPAGKYFLGDPCYCFEDSWSGIVDQLYEKDRNGYTAEINGKTILCFNTAYGDGGYYDSNHPETEFSVDAGLIGLTPVELIETSIDYVKDLGTFVEFTEETICESHENGTLRFGDWFIDTGYEEEYDDLDEDDIEEEE